MQLPDGRLSCHSAALLEPCATVLLVVPLSCTVLEKLWDFFSAWLNLGPSVS